MANLNKLIDRRKDGFIRSGKRFNFERRDHIRLLVEGTIFVNYKIQAKLFNIDFRGCCIECSQKLNGNVLVDLAPYFDLKFDTKIIWTEENKENNTWIYGFEFIFITEEKRKILRDTFFLNTQIFVEHALEINKQVLNLKVKNAILNFFVDDVKPVVEKLVEIEEKTKESVKIEKNIYLEIANILDDLLNKGNKLVVYINNPQIEQKIKQRVRAIVGYFLYQSKIMRRGLEKPHGYPGDYIMLEQVYDNEEISSGFGLYIDRHHLNDNYSKAVRGRKNWMRETIKKTLSTTDKNLKILNLASGSVRELRELFTDFQSPVGATITCLDQDITSINFSKEELQKFNTKPVEIEFLQENILHLDKINIEKESVDMVYSIGIADYLQDRMLDKIFKDSFNLLKVGGELAFAYKDIDKYKPLTPNWFCDWNFISRNEKEFVALVEKALEGQKYDLKIERELETKIIFFVRVVKL